MHNKITGAEILLESLKKEGVKYIFGYPGGVVLNIFDHLYENKDLNLILTRHEQGAVHAADGICKGVRKNRRGAGYLRPRGYEYRDWHCNCLDGFHTYCCVFRTGADHAYWK